MNFINVECVFNQCKKVFEKPNKMKQHQLTHLSARNFKCSFEGCNKMFKMAQHLNYHMTTHQIQEVSQKNICTFPGCQKQFKHDWILQDHLKTHENEFKFYCPYKDCDKKYNTRSNMEVHLRKHVGVRPYQCETCSRKFISSWNKQKHLRLGKCQIKDQ